MANMSVPELLKAMQNVDRTSITDRERQQLLLASQEVQAKLENPWDTIKRIVWIEVRAFGEPLFSVEAKLRFSPTALPASLLANTR